MDQFFLLDRMATISPGVKLHISGHLWKENVDEDDLTPTILINECFAIVIQEAYELGIEFYCTLADLCESFYTMDKVLLLLEVVFPTPLYRSLVEDSGFKKFIFAVADGTGDDESSIITILEYLAIYNAETSSVFYDVFEYLKDKTKSTVVFDTYLSSMLETDSSSLSAIVDQSVITKYLLSVHNKFSKLLAAADKLSPKITEKDTLAEVYDAINNYRYVAVASDTLDVYSWREDALSWEVQIPKIQALIEKYKIQFDSSVPFFDDYFVLGGRQVETKDVITLVLGAYLETTTRDAFLSVVTQVIERVQSHLNVITPEMNTLVQIASSILSQEYSV